MATKVSLISMEKGWIEERNRAWCTYAVEKWMSSLLFFLILSIWALCANCFLGTASFTITFYALRRRIGGYHANNQWTCLLSSVLLVVVVTLFIGPITLQLTLPVIIILNTLSLGMSLFIKPVYPEQVHFSVEEEEGNIKRKNRILLIVFAVQLLSIPLFGMHVIAYTFWGISAATVTVLIEKIRIERNKHYEEN